MTEENNKNNSLIPFGTSSLERVGSSISIVNKILNRGISDLFNKAFCKLNSSRNLSLDIDYLYLLETNPTQRKDPKYNYTAKTKNDYREALVLFTEVLKIKPKHVLSIEMGAICKSRLYNYYEAIEDFTKAIEIDPQYAPAYLGRGVAKKDLENYQGAIEDYSKAIEIDSKYNEAYVWRGNARCDLNDYHGAIEDYTKAIEIDHNDASAYGCRGITRKWIGDIEGAKEDNNKFNHLFEDILNKAK